MPPAKPEEKSHPSEESHSPASVSLASAKPAPPGEISIAPKVFFSIVQHAALSTYGVVGIASRYTGLDNTHKEPGRGIEVTLLPSSEGGAKRIAVDIHIIVEYGVRIPAVVSSLQHQIDYGINHSTGYTLDHIHIHVAAVRVTGSAD